MNSLLTAFEFALDTQRERSESVAFSGVLSLLLLLLCMELLLQFGARISTSQVHSRIQASYFCNIVFFFFATNVCLCVRVFFSPLSLGFMGFIVKLLVLGGYLFC